MPTFGGMLKIFVLFGLLFQPSIAGIVAINEVSDKGTENGQCLGNDWIEIVHIPNEGENSSSPISLEGYVLHDDRGRFHEEAFEFPAVDIFPGEYLVVCAPPPGNDTLLAPQFGIGGDDTIELLDANGTLVSSASLLGRGEFNITFIRLTDGTYNYTTFPTPGGANVFVQLPEPETVQEIKLRLAAQNALGEQFFGMDGRGYPVIDKMDDVLDLEVEMSEMDYNYVMVNRSFETYRPIHGVRLLTSENQLEIASWNGTGGRIRARGQSTLAIPSCQGQDKIPFTLDLGEQSLFGSSRFYLRNSAFDRSHMREWALHRMLARFGLPHLRTRKVRLVLNGNMLGLYDLMEAMDQEYVFARHFPDYDPNSYAMYKFKSMSMFCTGLLQDLDVARGKSLLEPEKTSPYLFERGEHRDYGPYPENRTEDGCFAHFITEVMLKEAEDTALAFVRHGERCGEMLVEEGIVDRDLGDSSFDNDMKSFLDKYYDDTHTCKAQDGCVDAPDLTADVDVTSFLKSFAFYAVILGGDSPLGNGNNFYLAQTGDASGRWKMIPWDLDLSATYLGLSICSPECPFNAVHWSIIQPTCGPVEESRLVGPLLSNESLRATYLDYVRDLVTTTMLNATFLDEIENHARAIEKYVEVDLYHVESDYNYTVELLPDPKLWNASGMPFLPFLVARGDDLAQQLEALESGTYPRGHEEILEWEKCVDWRIEEPPESPCYNACKYEGCSTSLMGGFCEPEMGICYNVDFDPQCSGVEIGESYEDMEDGTFCANGVKLSPCPQPPFTCDSAEDCQYKGCYQANWEVPSTCEDGVCYHGDSDTICEGVVDGMQPEGIEPMGEEKLFCRGGIKMSECLPPPIEPPACQADVHCQFLGCFEPSWTVPGACQAGMCYHGEADDNCEGVENGEAYEGMVPRGEEQLFCWDGVKMSACLPPPSGSLSDPDLETVVESVSESFPDPNASNTTGTETFSSEADFDPFCFLDTDCQYEGCYHPASTAPAMCELGICYYGETDPDCGTTTIAKSDPAYEERSPAEGSLCLSGLKLLKCPPPTERTTNDTSVLTTDTASANDSVQNVISGALSIVKLRLATFSVLFSWTIASGSMLL